MVPPRRPARRACTDCLPHDGQLCARSGVRRAGDDGAIGPHPVDRRRLPPDPVLGDLVAMAATVCATPVAYLSVSDGHERRFVAAQGIGPSDSARERVVASVVTT